MLTYNRLLIMIAVDILGDNSYGNHVAGLIINTTHRHQTFRRGIYVTLHRLVEIGYLDMWINTEEHPFGKKLRQNRPFYSLTKAGLAEVNRTMNELEDLVKLWEAPRMIHNPAA